LLSALKAAGSWKGQVHCENGFSWMNRAHVPLKGVP